MGKLTGLVMIVAGVGAAAYVYPLVGAGPDKAEKQLADVVAISTAGTAAPAPRIISAQPAPGRPTLTAPAVSTTPTAPAAAAPVVQAPAVVAATPAIAPALPVAKPVVDAPAPQAVAKPVEPPVPQIARRPKAEDEGKVTLARDIQRELKRVGCYSGDADGTWNTSTKQAMKSFIDRVNATLPTDEPDHILKTLVQGHPGNACGKSCPSGQSAASDGRCLPTGVMTQAPAKKAAPVETASIQAPKPSTPAVSEPVAKVPSAAQPKAAAASSWETTTTTVAPPAMAAIAAVSAAATAALDSKPTAPLPGRMAVGAAHGPAPAPQSVTQAPVTQPSEPQSADTAPASKPKAVVVKAKARSEPSENPDKPEKAEKPDPVEKAEKPSRPPVAAVTAAETPTPRRSAPAPAPAPRVAAYRPPPPPPRYVGVYSPPVRERPRFGPSIFRQMESNGR